MRQYRVGFSNDGGKEKIKRNIWEMSRIPDRLWKAIWDIEDELTQLGAPCNIESVYYPPGAFGSTSMTHPEFRAVDIEAKDISGNYLPKIVCERIQDRMNKKWAAMGMKVCVYHHGTGPHFHIQISRKYAEKVNITTEA